MYFIIQIQNRTVVANQLTLLYHFRKKNRNLIH